MSYYYKEEKTACLSISTTLLACSHAKKIISIFFVK